MFHGKNSVTDATIVIPTTIPVVGLPKKYPIQPHITISDKALMFSDIYFILNFPLPLFAILSYYLHKSIPFFPI